MTDLNKKSASRRFKSLTFIACCFLLFTFCTEKKKNKNQIELLSEIGFLSFATTAYRCNINSASNYNFFNSGDIPSGSSVTVKRINTVLKSAGTVEVYYPDTATKNLPVLALYQGGNVNSSFYSNYAARLAASDYVVYVANRCTTFILQYFIYPDASLASEVYDLAKTQSIDSTSPLFGRLDAEKIGVLGHSLGGVVGLFSINGICDFPFCAWATTRLAQIKAGLFYGSGLGESFDKKRYYTDSSGKGIPSGYIQGSIDTANTPDSSTKNFANVISPKYLFAIEGLNHYGITDVNNPFGAKSETNLSSFSQTQTIDKIASVSIEFLNAYIKNDSASLSKINSGNMGISGVTTTSSP